MSASPYYQCMNGDGSISKTTVADSSGAFVSISDPAVAAWLKTNSSGAVPLAQAQEARRGFLRAACTAEIIGGFSSSALGAAHTYPSTPNDQTNLIGAVTASQSPGLPSGWTCNFWCADSSGVWAQRSHTAAQIQKVLADGVVAREAASTKLVNAETQVQSATTVADVQKVVWP